MWCASRHLDMTKTWSNKASGIVFISLLITQFKCWNCSVPKGWPNILSCMRQAHMHVMSKHFSSGYFWSSRWGQWVWKSSVLVSYREWFSEIKKKKKKSVIIQPKMKICCSNPLWHTFFCETQPIFWTMFLCFFIPTIKVNGVQPVWKQSLFLQFCFFFFFC